MYKIGIAILALFMLSCGSDPSVHDHSEDDQHSDEAVQSTIFTNNLEFFIEYEAMEKGKASEFLVHITKLDTYEPIITGTLTLTIGNETVTSNAPDQPGIYHMSVFAMKAGGFHAVVSLENEDFQTKVEMHVEVHEGHDADHEDEEVDDHGHNHAVVAPGEVTFLKEQAWKGDFMVRKIIPTDFSSVLHVSGEILAMPGEKELISANSEGFVTFSGSQIVPGSLVRKGQKILVLKSRSLGEDDISLRYRDLQNSLDKSRSEYKRHMKLIKNSVISEKKLIESKSAYTADSLRFYNLASGISSGGVEIVAPLSGYIHSLNVSEGQFVQNGQQLFTISSDETLLMRADVPQQHYEGVKDVVTSNFRTAYSDQVFSIEEFQGHLKATGTFVTENDHFIPLYFEVENDGRLLEGAFVEFYLKSKNSIDALVVPSSAILEEQGANYVYVQVTGESYTKRAIQTGSSDGKNVEIINGLIEGERIVTDGVILVKAASMVVGGSGDGHQH
jgi:cobalt-zinc-cadmium efflux system membrane fusion protein